MLPAPLCDGKNSSIRGIFKAGNTFIEQAGASRGGTAAFYRSLFGEEFCCGAAAALDAG